MYYTVFVLYTLQLLLCGPHNTLPLRYEIWQIILRAIHKTVKENDEVCLCILIHMYLFCGFHTYTVLHRYGKFEIMFSVKTWVWKCGYRRGMWWHWLISADIAATGSLEHSRNNMHLLSHTKNTHSPRINMFSCPRGKPSPGWHQSPSPRQKQPKMNMYNSKEVSKEILRELGTRENCCDNLTPVILPPFWTPKGPKKGSYCSVSQKPHKLLRWLLSQC